MKLNDVLSKSIQFFKEKGFDSARLEAELLISHALKLKRIELYTKFDSPLTDAEVQTCRDYLKRRVAGEPVAYIVKEKGFFGLNFIVEPGVLIPRPETELLVEAALNYIKSQKLTAPRILDLGAGSGCIGFSILKSVPEATLVSIEKSEAAFTLLKKNADQLQLQNRVELLQLDVQNYNFISASPFDIIVANPPYIAVNDPEVDAHVKKFEPETALYAEDHGLACLKQWSQKALSALKPQGFLIMEMGYKQGPAMQAFYNELQLNHVEVLKDLSGLDRFIKGIA